MSNKCSVEYVSNKLVVTLEDGDKFEYPVATIQNSKSAIEYFPLRSNIVIMQIINVRLYDLINARNSDGLSSNEVKTFIIGVGPDVEGLSISDEVLIGDTQYLVYLPVTNNPRNALSIREYISNTYPALTIGYAVAADKSHSKVGLNTIGVQVLSQASIDRVNSSLATKDSSTFFKDADADTIQILMFSMCPSQMCNAIIKR